MKVKHVGFVAGILLLVTGAPIAAAGDWVVENASGLKWFENPTTHHLVVDSTGRPCAAFGGDHLYYARFNGAIWEVETVDEARGVGSHAALALDGGLHPRIAYFDEENHDLKCASWELTGGKWQWVIETAAATGYVGEGCAIALDGGGRPHIICINRTTNSFDYVYRSSSGWQSPVPIGIPSVDHCSSSMVLDDSGYPHVVAQASDDSVRYAWKDAGGWHSSVLSSISSHFATSGLVRRGSFLECAFYEENGGSRTIRYVSFAAGSAAVFLDNETVATLAIGSQPEIALALSGPTAQPRLAYTRYGDATVHHFARTGTNAWTETVLNAGTGVYASQVSLAMNSFDRAFVHYLTKSTTGQGVDQMVCREQFGTSTWDSPVGYAYGSTADEHADLAVTGNGTPVIAFHNPTLRGTMFRERVTAGSFTGWVSYGDPDLTGDCGEWVSIAAAAEHPLEFHVACYVPDTGDLRYQRWHGYAAAGPAMLDSSIDAGRYASLATHPASGNPGIAYYDASNGHLKYAFLSAPLGTPIWSVQTIDSTNNTGKFAAQAFDAAGNPWVAYRRDVVGEVRVIHRISGTWQAPEVVLTGLDPEHISIAIDGDDLPHVALIDASSGTLWHAWKMGDGNWDWEQVAPGSIPGLLGHTGILLDPQGLPSILFRDYDHVRVARRTGGGGWILETVAYVYESNQDSRAVTMIRGANGRPMVCYYDALLRDVMVAWKQEPHIISIEEVAADQYELEWTGEGTGVWIDRSPNLEPGSWTPAAGPVTGYSHTLGETAGRMFYRLRAE